MEAVVSMAQIFVLGVARTGAFISQAPILGTRVVPMPVKAALALCLGVFFFHGSGGAPAGWLPFTGLLAKEVIVGYLMGLSLVLLLAALQAVGEWVGFQMMFSAATTFSMLNMEQNTVTGNFFNIITMLVFVALDGQHALLGALDLSFQVLPVLQIPPTLGSFPTWVALFGRVFELSFKLALPLMAALFITNVILGIIARTMPQINLFVIGMPMQIVAGFIILIFMIPGIVAVEGALFHQWAHELKSWIHLLTP